MKLVIITNVSKLHKFYFFSRFRLTSSNQNRRKKTAFISQNRDIYSFIYSLPHGQTDIGEKWFWLTYLADLFGWFCWIIYCPGRVHRRIFFFNCVLHAGHVQLLGKGDNNIWRASFFFWLWEVRKVLLDGEDPKKKYSLLVGTRQRPQ